MNRNRQMLVCTYAKGEPCNHPFARLVMLVCGDCKKPYGANTCDAHNRKCPYCMGGRPGLPLPSEAC